MHGRIKLDSSIVAHEIPGSLLRMSLFTVFGNRLIGFKSDDRFRQEWTYSSLDTMAGPSQATGETKLREGTEYIPHTIRAAHTYRPRYAICTYTNVNGSRVHSVCMPPRSLDCTTHCPRNALAYNCDLNPQCLF